MKGVTLLRTTRPKSIFNKKKFIKKKRKTGKACTIFDSSKLYRIKLDKNCACGRKAMKLFVFESGNEHYFCIRDECKVKVCKKEERLKGTRLVNVCFDIDYKS